MTTNYDNVIEAYCCHTNKLLVDGFRPSKNGDHRVWEGSWDMTGGGIRLIKLHGSVTWQRTGDQIIGMLRPGARDIDERVLIEPTLEEKDYTQKPFRELAEQGGSVLSDANVLVVVGYSFRDVMINDWLVWFMERGDPIVVISPNAENDIRQNLKRGAELLGGDKPCIKMIQKPFQHDTADEVCGGLKEILTQHQQEIRFSENGIP